MSNALFLLFYLFSKNISIFYKIITNDNKNIGRRRVTKIPNIFTFFFESRQAKAKFETSFLLSHTIAQLVVRDIHTQKNLYFHWNSIKNISVQLFIQYTYIISPRSYQVVYKMHICTNFNEC